MKIDKTKAENKKRKSLIAAVVHVSESEIAFALPDYDASWEDNKPSYFEKVLWNFGLDTNKSYIRQDAVWHRNKMNQIVFCSRWYGVERGDSEYLNSGHASQMALDRAKSSGILEDLYRSKGLTWDTQEYLEQRDKRAEVVKEDE